MTGAPEAVLGGRRPALEAVRARRALEVLVAEGTRETPALRDLVAACRETGVPMRERPRAELERMAPDHHGVVVRMRTAAVLGERELATWPFGNDDVVVALDGIVDPHNLGAAARAAEAAGVAMLVTRVRRAAALSTAAIRASAGALLHLPHARVVNIPRALGRLQDAGFFVVGLDERSATSVYDEPCPSGRVAVAVGSEGEGLSRLTRRVCDALVSLPMRGRVGSLNASSALAAVLYAYVLPSRG